MWRTSKNNVEDTWESLGGRRGSLTRHLEVFKHVGVVLQTLWNHVEDIWESLGGHLGNIWRASGFPPTRRRITAVQCEFPGEVLHSTGLS